MGPVLSYLASRSVSAGPHAVLAQEEGAVLPVHTHAVDRQQDGPLGPAVLVSVIAAAVVLSTLLSAYLDVRTVVPKGPPDPPARAERTGAEATTEGTDLKTTSERTAPATGGPSASAGASASTSLPASASASP